jgi:hypothetical protein
MPEVRWGMGGGNITFNTLFMGNLLSLPHSPFVYCAFNTLFEGNFQILLVTIAAALNPFNTLSWGTSR